MFESLDSYMSYLEAHQSKFPEHIYQFAADESRHNLQSPHSLHDSWLSSLSIKEPRNTGSEITAWPNIELILLGQMHDRNISLLYTNVHSYKIVGSKNPYNWADTFHGDIEAHKITLGSHATFLHEISFVSGSKILIEFEGFQCTEIACT